MKKIEIIRKALAEAIDEIFTDYIGELGASVLFFIFVLIVNTKCKSLGYIDEIVVLALVIAGAICMLLFIHAVIHLSLIVQVISEAKKGKYSIKKENGYFIVSFDSYSVEIAAK